jgi:hypothetical protein
LSFSNGCRCSRGNGGSCRRPVVPCRRGAVSLVFIAFRHHAETNFSRGLLHATLN